MFSSDKWGSSWHLCTDRLRGLDVQAGHSLLRRANVEWCVVIWLILDASRCESPTCESDSAIGCWTSLFLFWIMETNLLHLLWRRRRERGWRDWTEIHRDINAYEIGEEWKTRPPINHLFVRMRRNSFQMVLLRVIRHAGQHFLRQPRVCVHTIWIMLSLYYSFWFGHETKDLTAGSAAPTETMFNQSVRWIKDVKHKRRRLVIK